MTTATGRDTSSAYRVAVAGDIGSDRPSIATLEGIARDAPDLYLALGDFSYAGPGSEAAWCDLVRSILGDIPVAVVAGNHEEDTGEDGRIENYVALLPDPVGAVGEYGIEYYFDVGDLVRFVVLSPGLTIDDRHYYYGHDNDNIRWVAEVIDDARQRRIPWVVAAMHKNSLSMGPYYCEIYQHLLSLLIDKRVDLVLHGHDHVYQRTKQLRAGCDGCDEVVIDEYNAACVGDDGRRGVYRKGAGTVFVTSGAAGAELYPIDESDPEAPYFASWMGANHKPTHGFVTLSLTPDALACEFVPTSRGPFRDDFRIENATAR